MIVIRKFLAEETNTVESYDDLAVSYYNMGIVLRERSYLNEALNIWTQLAEQFPDNPIFQQRKETVIEALIKLFGT